MTVGIRHMAAHLQDAAQTYRLHQHMNNITGRDIKTDQHPK